MNVAGTAIQSVVGVATAATGALLAVEAATEEYRIAQGKLNTAFEAAGMSSQAAQESYKGFYQILGETDTATEASQLLAQLAESEADVATWTNIAAGVNGTFGDSLPIEGLIESANETAKVGQVTGVLADALNWVGISEDEFNEKLKAASSESERNQLIMNTLSSTYDEAAAAFYRNNEALIAARDNQISMDEALAKLGETVSNVKNQVISEFMPSISQLVSAFSDMLNGVEGADEALSEAISGLIGKLTENIPQFIGFGIEIVKAIVKGIVDNAEQIADGTLQIADSLAAGLVEIAPVLLEGGAILIGALVQGLVARIPDLIAKLPDIIVAIVQFFADHIDEIMQAGFSILVAIGVGLIQAIPKLLAALPEIAAAIVQGFASLIGEFAKIGQYIIEGLWMGIANMGQWLMDKIKEFIDSIVDWFKELFGIHSPSKETEWMGEMIDKGFANGILKNRGMVKNAFSKLNFADELAAQMPELHASVSGTVNGFAPAHAAAGAPQTTHTVQEINRNTTQTVRVVADQRGIFKIVQAEEKRAGKSLVKQEGRT